MEDWAIVVGITAYPSLGELKGPERDAQDFYKWVTTMEGGGIDPDSPRAKLIISSKCAPPPPYGSHTEALPQMEAINEALAEMRKVALENLNLGHGRQAGRRLYLYFAGHGFSPGDDVALLTANSAAGVYANHVPGTAWAEWFWKSGYFEEILLFMDCCRDFIPGVPANPIILGPPTPGGAKIPKRLYGFATDWNKLAWERPMEDGEIHGVFSRTLITGLKGAACDRFTGEITTSSLRAYLKDAMPYFFHEQDRNNPTIRTDPKLPDWGDGDFTIARVPAVPMYQVRVSLPHQFQNQPLNLIFGSGLDMKRLPLSSTGETLNLILARGSYVLEVDRPDGPRAAFDVRGIGQEHVSV